MRVKWLEKEGREGEGWRISCGEWHLESGRGDSVVSAAWSVEVGQPRLEA